MLKSKWSKIVSFNVIRNDQLESRACTLSLVYNDFLQIRGKEKANRALKSVFKPMFSARQKNYLDNSCSLIARAITFISVDEI